MSREQPMDSLRAELQRRSPTSILPLFLPKIGKDYIDTCCLSKHKDAFLDHSKEDHDFSIQNLAWAIQSGVSGSCIERYLTQSDESNIEKKLWRPVQITSGIASSFPILYFAAERNSAEIVRILCHAGAVPSQEMCVRGSLINDLPLLPYTVLSAEYNLTDTTETVDTLLAMGASPYDVPKDMWQEYLKAPRENVPKQSEESDFRYEWCTTEIRQALCKTLNLHQRYSLWKAAQIERPNVREIQVAKGHNMMPLFELPYHLCGQHLATSQVLQQITNLMLFNSPKPLVLLFTGLSGHGKTTLARRMGGLLSLELLVVDCTMMRHDTDLFGPWHQHVGSKEASRFNNHLAKWDGKRTVVFLSNFEKTTDEVRIAMLLLFESGLYTDRRNNVEVDCSKVIWTLGAGIGIRGITNFWAKYLKDKSQEQQKQAPIKNFQINIKKAVIRTLGASLTERCSAIVPFLPFDKEERAVIAYKFMLKLWYDVRKPIDTARKHFAGNLFVNFINDGQIAAHVAERYLENTGARSIAKAVQEEIRDKLAAEILREEGEVSDKMNRLPLPNFDVRLVGDTKGNNFIEVSRRGTRSLQSAPA